MLLHRITVTGFWQSHATQGGDARGGTRGTGSALRCIGRPVRRRTRGNGTIGREAGRAAGQSAVPPGGSTWPRATARSTRSLPTRRIRLSSRTLYLAESSSGSLNEGYDISAGYNWTSRRASAPESSTRADSSRPNATGSGARAASTTSRRSSSPGSGRAQMALPGKRGHRLRPLHPQLRRYIGQQGRRRHP